MPFDGEKPRATMIGRLTGAWRVASGQAVAKAVSDMTVAPRPTQTYGPMGVSGAVIVGGYPSTDETTARLSQTMRWRTYNEVMANCSIVAAGVRYFLNLVAKAGWKCDPADESDKAREFADKMEDILEDMEEPWHKVARRAAMSRFYGFSIQEIVAKRRDDGMIGILALENRPQNTVEQWQLDANGMLQAVGQRNPNNGQMLYIPRGKVLYLVDDALTDNPAGMGLMRHLVPSFDRLRRYEELEGWGYEGDIRGTPLARAPLAELRDLVDKQTITKEDLNNALKPLEDFVDRHLKDPSLGLLLDSGTYRNQDDAAAPSQVKKFDVELMRGEGGPHQEMAAAIQRVNTEIARVLGVEHLLLGSDGSGSLALGKEKTHNFYLLVDGALREIRDQAQRDVVKYMWDLNGFPADMMPQLKHEPVQFRDIEQITVALRDMATAGAVIAPDDPAINEVRDLMGLQHATSVDARWPAQATGTTDEPTVTLFDNNGNPVEVPAAHVNTPAAPALPGGAPGMLPGQNPPGSTPPPSRPGNKSAAGKRAKGVALDGAGSDS